MGAFLRAKCSLRLWYDFIVFRFKGSPLVKLTAMDKDEGVNGEKIFLIADGNEKGVFQLDLQCGDLSLKPGIDPLKVAGRYNLKIEVWHPRT